MIELLKLCGFEANEIETELPRVERAFNRLGMTVEDIERAKQRLTKYYDIELKGVRKLLRLVVQEVVDILLAREEGKTKIFYGFMASGFTIFGSALRSRSKEICAAHLGQQFQFVVGSIFDKMVPILEAAEQLWLKAGKVSHCGNVKTLVGLLALDLIPRPDLIVTSGTLCDAAPKTIDLIHELYGIHTCSYDTCQDRDFREYPTATKRIVDLAAKSMRKVNQRIEKVAGFEITDAMLWEVLDVRDELGYALGKLQILIESSNPLPIRPNNQMLWICLLYSTLSIDSLSDAIDAVNTLNEELQERVNKGLGAVESGAPKILTLHPTHFTDPRLDHLISEIGIAIVSTDVTFKASDLDSDLESSGDPYEVMLLSHLQRSPPAGLQRRILLLIEECKRLKVDGLLDRYHVGCRSVTGDALMIKKAIIKELGIPVLLLERDDFDPRTYSEDQNKRSLELFKTMLIKTSN